MRPIVPHIITLGAQLAPLTFVKVGTNEASRSFQSGPLGSIFLWRAAMSIRTHQPGATNFGALRSASSELDQLKKENELLKKENEQLKQQIEQFKESIKKPKDTIDTLEEIIVERDDDIDTLKKEIDGAPKSHAHL
jgi:peptidoglycan hydrolase CwlO-like protein